MLSQFRERAGVSGLRQINEQLLAPLLPKRAGEGLSVALIDATDLEAASSGHKKRTPDSIRPNEPPWVAAPSSVGRAVFSSATRNIPFGFGCSTINEGCCWCR